MYYVSWKWESVISNYAFLDKSKNLIILHEIKWQNYFGMCARLNGWYNICEHGWFSGEEKHHIFCAQARGTKWIKQVNHWMQFNDWVRQWQLLN